MMQSFFNSENIPGVEKQYIKEEIKEEIHGAYLITEEPDYTVAPRIIMNNRLSPSVLKEEVGLG